VPLEPELLLDAELVLEPELLLLPVAPVDPVVAPAVPPEVEVDPAGPPDPAALVEALALLWLVPPAAVEALDPTDPVEALEPLPPPDVWPLVPWLRPPHPVATWLVPPVPDPVSLGMSPDPQPIELAVADVAAKQTQPTVENRFGSVMLPSFSSNAKNRTSTAGTAEHHGHTKTAGARRGDG